MGAVALETMYGNGHPEGNIGALMEQKNLQGQNIAGKVLVRKNTKERYRGICILGSSSQMERLFLQRKRRSFRVHPAGRAQAHRKRVLGRRELYGASHPGNTHFIQWVENSIKTFLEILGIYPTKSTRLSDHPSPLEWFEFIRWHLIKFPVVSGNLIRIT